MIELIFYGVGHNDIAYFPAIFTVAKSHIIVSLEGIEGGGDSYNTAVLILFYELIFALRVDFHTFQRFQVFD